MLRIESCRIENDVSETSLDRYLSHDLEDPWSWVRSAPHLDLPAIALAKQQQLQDLLSELPHSCDEPFETEICIGNQFLFSSVEIEDGNHFSLNSYVFRDEEQIFDDFEMCLEEVTLVIYQTLLGETDPKTLKRRFDLAKLYKRSDIYEKAEHHCRQILEHRNQIDVQTFLGIMLMDKCRLEEATFLLFSALTEFMLQFRLSSIEENIRFNQLITELFSDIVSRDFVHDWNSLTAYKLYLVNIIFDGSSHNSIDPVSPQLLLCGRFFAQECTALGFLESARHIDRHILARFPTQLNAVGDLRYWTEKAKAHQKASADLKEASSWNLLPGAQQLLLAFEALMHSKIQDSQLAAVLESDYNDFMKDQSVDSHETEHIVKQLREIWTHCRTQNDPQIQQLSRGIESLPIDNYLACNDQPVVFMEPASLAILPPAQNHLPTKSMSTCTSGGKYGLTHSWGSESMVSNSYIIEAVARNVL